MKDIILVVLILLSVGLSVMVVRFNEKANKAYKNLEEERYSRMVAEDSLQRNSAKISTYEAQIKSANEKMAKIQDILDQEKNVNQDLKDQYEKLSETKAQLEEKLSKAIEQQGAIAQSEPVKGVENPPSASASGAGAQNTGNSDHPAAP